MSLGPSSGKVACISSWPAEHLHRLTNPKSTKGEFCVVPSTMRIVVQGYSIALGEVKILSRQVACPQHIPRLALSAEGYIHLIYAEAVGQPGCRMESEIPEHTDLDLELLASFDLDVSDTFAALVSLAIRLGIFSEWLTIHEDSHIDEILHRHREWFEVIGDSPTELKLTEG